MDGKFCTDTARRVPALWTKNYIVILALGTLTSTCFYMITPILAKFAVEIGATLAVAGTIAGLFSVTALFVRPISGVCADRVNRGGLLLVSTVFILIAAVMYSFAHSLAMLTVTRVIHGAAFAFSGTVTVAVIASIVPRERLGEGVGYYGLGNIIATAAGPNLGIFIGDGYGYRAVFPASAALLVLAVLVIVFFLKIPPIEKSVASSLPPVAGRPAVEGKKPFSVRELISLKILPLAVIGGFFSFLNGIIGSFLVLLADERQIAGIGIYFTVNAACLLIIRPFAGRVSDKKRLGFILYPSLILAAAAAVLLGFAGSIAVIVTAAVLKAAGQGAGQPALQAACIKLLPPEKSGLAASTFYIGADIGQGLGPIIGGAASDAWGYGAMFYGCAGLLIGGMFMYRAYAGKK